MIDQQKGSRMDGIKQQIYARKQEAMETKHFHDVRKNNRKLRENLNELKDKNSTTLTSVKKDYDRSVLDEKTKMEVQLSKIRNKNQEIIKAERDRYQRMVSEIKSSHEEKMSELKISQEKEYDNATESHNASLEEARDRYLTKASKYEV